jgi:hypothetical protein
MMARAMVGTAPVSARASMPAGSTRMGSMRRGRRSVGALLALVAVSGSFLATGCDCRATVTPRSPVLGDVRVEIAGSEGLCGGDPSIGDVEVYRGSTELVWAAAFNGSSNYPTVREIKYGSPPPGFTEQKAPVPLAVNDTIHFRVHGPGFRGDVSMVIRAPALLDGSSQ